MTGTDRYHFTRICHNRNFLGVKLDMPYFPKTTNYRITPYYQRFPDNAHRIDLAYEMLAFALNADSQNVLVLNLADPYRWMFVETDYGSWPVFTPLYTMYTRTSKTQVKTGAAVLISTCGVNRRSIPDSACRNHYAEVLSYALAVALGSHNSLQYSDYVFAPGGPPAPYIFCD